MALKIFHLSQNENTGYDTYDSFVVAAENFKEALHTHPDIGILKRWDEHQECWVDDETKKPVKDIFPTWVTTIENVKCVYIGRATEDVAKGVICASFNAG